MRERLEPWITLLVRKPGGPPERHILELNAHSLPDKLANELSNVVVIPGGTSIRTTDQEGGNGHVALAYSEDMSELFERLQQEVQEIADVLAREKGMTPTEVWEEALSLHRVRYETVPLPDTSLESQ